MNGRRILRDAEHERQRLSLNQMIRQSKQAWHGTKLDQPDWRGNSHSVAFSAEILKEKMLFHMILNAYWEPLDFELPPAGSGGPWRLWIDTSLASPSDIVEWRSATSVSGYTYRAEARSVVVLFAIQTVDEGGTG